MSLTLNNAQELLLSKFSYLDFAKKLMGTVLINERNVVNSFPSF
jgi:hypothetical protein